MLGWGESGVCQRRSRQLRPRVWRRKKRVFRRPVPHITPCQDTRAPFVSCQLTFNNVSTKNIKNEGKLHTIYVGRYVRVAGYEGGAHVFSDGSDVSEIVIFICDCATQVAFPCKEDNYRSVLSKWEYFIKMRAAYLLSPSFITQGRMGASKAALILMKNSHFDRTLQ